MSASSAADEPLFFCHRCNDYLNSQQIGESFTCSRCHDGFIERVERRQMPQGAHVHTEGSRIQVPPDGGNVNPINIMNGILSLMNPGPPPPNNIPNPTGAGESSENPNILDALRLMGNVMRGMRPNNPTITIQTRRTVNLNPDVAQAEQGNAPPPNGPNPADVMNIIFEILGSNANRQPQNAQNQANGEPQVPNAAPEQPDRPQGISFGDMLRGFVQTMNGQQGNTGQQQNPPGTGQHQNQPGTGQPETGFIAGLIRALAPQGAEVHIQVQGGEPITLENLAVDGDMENLLNQLMSRLTGEQLPIGISERDMQRLPMIKVSQKHVENESQCITCMETFKLEEDVVELGCHHIFHKPCLIPWLQNHRTCPICRQTIDPGTWPAAPDRTFADTDDLD